MATNCRVEHHRNTAGAARVQWVDDWVPVGAGPVCTEVFPHNPYCTVLPHKTTYCIPTTAVPKSALQIGR
jgi:hypothetical protein